MAPRSGPGWNINERVDYFWKFQSVRVDNSQSRFLEVRDECSFTMGASTPNDYHGQSAPPAANEVQERIRFLQTQIKLLRTSSKRVSPPLQYQRVPNRATPPRPQPPPTIYSRPARSVDEAATRRPPYSMEPVLMPPRHSDEREFEFPAADTLQMPELERNAFDVPPEYGATFQRYRDTPSEEPAVNFRQ